MISVAHLEKYTGTEASWRTEPGTSLRPDPKSRTALEANEKDGIRSTVSDDAHTQRAASAIITVHRADKARCQCFSYCTLLL